MSAVLRKVTADDMLADPMFYILVVEYEQESANPELGRYDWQAPIYRALEEEGKLHIVAAYNGGKLVGFATAITSILPHCGKLIASTESLFVSKEQRKGRLGMNLVEELEYLAKQNGAMALFLTAPVNGALGKLAPRMGYRHTNEVFFKALH